MYRMEGKNTSANLKNVKEPHSMQQISLCQTLYSNIKLIFTGQINWILSFDNKYNKLFLQSLKSRKTFYRMRELVLQITFNSKILYRITMTDSNFSCPGSLIKPTLPSPDQSIYPRTQIHKHHAWPLKFKWTRPHKPLKLKKSHCIK